jgi:hypothetical protein
MESSCAGEDPRIHPFSRRDGLPGQARQRRQFSLKQIVVADLHRCATQTGKRKM